MDAQWRRRLDQERRIGNLTVSHELVLAAIGRDLALGYPEPSEARLMSEAGVSRSTVQRAKSRGRQLGLLEWERQFAWDGGRRVERPCAYRTTTPATAPQKRERQPEARTKNNIQRSVEAQLRALPTPTHSQIQLWSDRRAAMYGTQSSQRWKNEPPHPDRSRASAEGRCAAGREDMIRSASANATSC